MWKITEVSKILGPDWKFYIDDFYGDKGSCDLPKIEELNILSFKFVGKNLLSKLEEQQLIYKIKQLNIGENIEITKHTYFGRYLKIYINK